MAQKVKITLEDDLTGGAAEETVRFGLDGKFYEIDLSAGNAAQLRDAVRPFTNQARQVQTGKRAKAPKGASSQHKGETAKVRAWAQENGYDVAERGRIHQHIINAYYAAQEGSSNEE